MTEHEIITSIVADVATSAGVTPPRVLTPAETMYIAGPDIVFDPVQAFYSPEDYAIGYGIGITRILDSVQLHGVMAHELAHTNTLDETEADKQAAKWGFGDQLISALRIVTSSGTDGYHAETSVRIAAIQDATASCRVPQCIPD